MMQNIQNVGSMAYGVGSATYSVAKPVASLAYYGVAAPVVSVTYNLTIGNYVEETKKATSSIAGSIKETAGNVFENSVGINNFRDANKCFNPPKRCEVETSANGKKTTYKELVVPYHEMAEGYIANASIGVTKLGLWGLLGYGAACENGLIEDTGLLATAGQGLYNGAAWAIQTGVSTAMDVGNQAIEIASPYVTNITDVAMPAIRQAGGKIIENPLPLVGMVVGGNLGIGAYRDFQNIGRTDSKLAKVAYAGLGLTKAALAGTVLVYTAYFNPF